MHKMKKVLVIVYYWPPSGGGGVQRWVKLAKYLPQMGWEPIIYAPDEADYPLMDHSLEADISPDLQLIRNPIIEPRKIYAKWLGKGEKEAKPNQPSADEIFYHDASQRSWKQNLALWIRGNLFIPDARALWIRPSIRFLKKYLKDHPVDAIISTGPPHSLHLIGEALHRKLDIPWIADFRDAWTEIEFFDKLMLSRWAENRHHKLERKVLKQADLSLVTADYWIDLYQKRGAQRVEVLLNGFDKDDFQHVQPTPNAHFALSHVGTLAHDRNPMSLWEALRELSDEIPTFRDKLQVHFAGKTDSLVKKSLADLGLGDHIHDHGYISHHEAISLMAASPLLLLLINQSEKNALGRVPGKVFEYLAAQRPILCIGPEGSSIDRILQDSQAGESIAFDDKDGLKQSLHQAFTQWQSGAMPRTKEVLIEPYTRRAQAAQLSGFLHEIIDD